MELTRRRLLAGLSAGAATLWLGACSRAATPERAAPAPTPAGDTLARVRVGYVAALIYSPLFVAIEKGYFREQGIEVTPIALAGGTDIIAQTVAGNFEVGLGGLGVGALNAARRTLDFRIVASHHAESPPLSTPLVVARRRFDDGTYRRAADLRGKRVSINAKGSATEYWLHAALAKDGLTIKDIELTALPFGEVAPALENGALDGAMLGEPLITLAEQKGLARRIADDFLTGAQGTVIYYNAKWGREQQGVAGRWLAAWLRGARDLGGGGYGDDANAAIVEKYTNTPRDVVKLASPPVHDPNGALNLADMQAQQEYFLASGALTYDAPLDLNTLVDTSHAERAVAIIGRA